MAWKLWTIIWSVVGVLAMALVAAGLWAYQIFQSSPNHNPFL